MRGLLQAILPQGNLTLLKEKTVRFGNTSRRVYAPDSPLPLMYDPVAKLRTEVYA